MSVNMLMLVYAYLQSIYFSHTAVILPEPTEIEETGVPEGIINFLQKRKRTFQLSKTGIG
jgi:hypothetical protein